MNFKILDYKFSIKVVEWYLFIFFLEYIEY
jgi:hypothetical protein